MIHSFENYRQYPAISNSDLTEFRDFLFGFNRFKPYKAFEVGSAVHEALLEPKKPHIFSENVNLEQVAQLAKNVRSHPFCQWILQFSRKEIGFLFQDKETGLPCKAKLDTFWRQHLIVDFKTTSQPSYKAFVDSCFEYEYDHQAAFYLDAVKQNFNSTLKLVFVGIQKKEPFDLFLFDATANNQFIELGRKKYKALLRKWNEMGGVPKGFTPLSWNVELLKQVA